MIVQLADRKTRVVYYEYAFKGEVLETDTFMRDSLEIESYEPGFNSGISIYFHIINEDITWMEYIWVDEIDEFDGNEFGWWLI